MRDDTRDRLIPPQEAGARFGVSARTLRRWHAAGLISAQRTLGGHRRYRESEIRALVGRAAGAVA